MLAALVPCVVSLALRGNIRPLVVGLVSHSLWAFALMFIWLSGRSFWWKAGLAVELVLGLVPACTVVFLFKRKDVEFLLVCVTHHLATPADYG